MKLTGGRARAFCARPDVTKCGALLYGADTALVALARQELVRALTHGDDLRLERQAATQAVRDPAAVDAALRSRGFFAERPVVLVEGAGDALARPLAEILPEIGADDGFLLVTAGSLPARSGLRKLFENDDRLVALALYGGPPEPGEVEEMLAEKGLRDKLAPDAVAELAAAAQALDRGQLAQLIEKIGVYLIDREAELAAAELSSLLPEAAEAELDSLIHAVAEGRADLVGPLMTRLSASGTTPVTILIATTRHFRTLLQLATAPDGIGSALARVRPQVFGPRRDALARQGRSWGTARLESALRLLFQTDRRLRSAGSRPDQAIVERCLMRLSMIARQAGGG